MLSARPVCLGVLFCAATLWGQQMISVRSGLIHYTEGTVTVDGKQVENKNSEFSSLLTNQELQTGEGRAELLLTPGAFLRVGENSAIRMVSTDLSNTQVEVLKGSALVEVTALGKDNAISLLSHGATLQVQKAGIFRVDSDPASFKVYEGQGFVSEGATRQTLNKGKEVLLADDTVASVKSFDTKDTDDLYRWSARRSSYVAMANVALAKAASSDSFFGGSGGYGNGCLGGCWGFNPAFGMYSYLPFGGVAYSPFGYTFWNPFNSYYAPYYYYPGGSYPILTTAVNPVTPVRGLPVVGGTSNGFSAPSRVGSGVSAAARPAGGLSSGSSSLSSMSRSGGGHHR